MGREEYECCGKGTQIVLHNMSAPPRTRFESKIEPIGSGPILFDLKALLDELGINLGSLSKRSSIFKALVGSIPAQELVDCRARTLPKFLISVLPQENSPEEYSKDLELSLAVLSRRTGKFFMASRTPDYSIGFLVQEKFRIDSF